MLFSWLSKYIVDINSEERHGNFSKRLHKLSGHLFLIINFNNLDQQKTQQIIKALSAYSNLSGNTLTTYVPYKTKESSTLIALTGKNIVVGNYSTITITKVNDALSKLLKVYYSTYNYKSILENFNSEQVIDMCHSFDDLVKIKLNVTNEENIKNIISVCTKEDLKNLMESVDDILK